jgi:hypothetical protein
MGLGGPVWHASAAASEGWPLGKESLRRFALEALEGVGDANRGEWEEWTGYAFHIRRRLSAEEQEPIGEVVDIRGTPEARRRIERVIQYAMRSPQGLRILREEARGATA